MKPIPVKINLMNRHSAEKHPVAVNLMFKHGKNRSKPETRNLERKK
ncbi:MAG: hypothetical protein WAT19_11750 [Ferruginibacter sp.]